MEIDLKKIGEIDVVGLNGRMDVPGAETAQEFFSGLLAGDLSGRKIVVDMKSVDYVSSSGLRVFVQSLKTAQAGQAELVLCAMNVDVEEVFHFAGIDELVRIFPDADQAVDALG